MRNDNENGIRLLSSTYRVSLRPALSAHPFAAEQSIADEDALLAIADNPAVLTYTGLILMLEANPVK